MSSVAPAGPPPSAVRAAWPVVAAALAIVAFPALGGRYAVDLATTIIVAAIFALSLALLVGEAGLVSFGHAAFLGIGAYATALLARGGHAPSLLWLAPVAVLVTAACALVIGALAIRTRGVYFIMVTLAFSQMAYYVFHDTGIGGGSDGLYLDARPTLPLVASLGDARTFYYLAAACLAATFLLLAAVKRARFGHALAGIRVNEARMRAAGCSTYVCKLAAFTLAGALAGVAGLLWAIKDGFVHPELLAWHQSGSVLLMLIIGGIGSLRGAVAGAAAFILMKEAFQSEALFGAFATHWQLPLGVAIIALVAALPRGLAGLAAASRSRRRARSGAEA